MHDAPHQSNLASCGGSVDHDSLSYRFSYPYPLVERCGRIPPALGTSISLRPTLGRASRPSLRLRERPMSPEPKSGPTNGMLLSNRYRLEQVLGQGAMGSVWSARDERLGLDVAVKVFVGGQTGQSLLEPDRARFEEEQKILAQLRSPYVVQIRDRGLTPDHQPYYVMDRFDGRSLREHLSEVERMPVSEVLELLEELGRAIQEPHAKGLIHRDIKPGNIFLLEYPGQRHLAVRLLDFGIAKSLSPKPDAHGETQPGAMLGTPLYIAPEQIQGRASQASDIYAIGIVAYRCLAGRPPFEADQVAAVLTQHLAVAPPPFEKRLEVPKPVDGLVRRLLQKDPEWRPNAVELVEAVQQVRFVLEGPRSNPASLHVSDSIPPPVLTFANPEFDGTTTPPSWAAEFAAPGRAWPPCPPGSSTSTPSWPPVAGVRAPDSGPKARKARPWRSALLAAASASLSLVGWGIAQRQDSDERSVELRVDSRPAGAIVHFDHRKLGPTPVFALVRTGRMPVELRLERPGFQTLSRKIQLTRDTHLDVDLTPRPTASLPASRSLTTLSDPPPPAVDPHRSPRRLRRRSESSRPKRSLRRGRPARTPPAAAEPTGPASEAAGPTRPTSEAPEPTRPAAEAPEPTGPASEAAGPTRPTSEAPEPTRPAAATVQGGTVPAQKLSLTKGTGSSEQVRGPPEASSPAPALVGVVFRHGDRGPVRKLRIGGRVYGGPPIRIRLPALSTIDVEHLGEDGVWRKIRVRVPADGGVVALH